MRGNDDNDNDKLQLMVVKSGAMRWIMVTPIELTFASIQTKRVDFILDLSSSPFGILSKAELPLTIKRLLTFPFHLLLCGVLFTTDHLSRETNVQNRDIAVARTL